MQKHYSETLCICKKHLEAPVRRCSSKEQNALHYVNIKGEYWSWVLRNVYVKQCILHNAVLWKCLLYAKLVYMKELNGKGKSFCWWVNVQVTSIVACNLETCTDCFCHHDKFQTDLLRLFWACHVTYAFQSESTLYSCLNVKELLARSRREPFGQTDQLVECSFTN